MRRADVLLLVKKARDQRRDARDHAGKIRDPDVGKQLLGICLRILDRPLRQLYPELPALDRGQIYVERIDTVLIVIQFIIISISRVKPFPPPEVAFSHMLYTVS